MFTKERLYTPEGGLVTEVALPPFITKPEVLIWGARVFIHVDSFLELTENEGMPPAVEADIEGGCYVEAFAYHVPPTAEELPDSAEYMNRREGLDRRLMEGVLQTVGIAPAPDHYVSRLMGESPEPGFASEGERYEEGQEASNVNQAALDAHYPPLDPWVRFSQNSEPPGPGETPLFDRVYIDPSHGNGGADCTCHELAPCYHYISCPVATWGLLQGHARQVYKRARAEVFTLPECPFKYCSDPERCKSLEHCQHKNRKSDATG